MLLIWYASFFVFVATFVFGVINRSVILLFVSVITSTSFAFYFLAAVNAWKYVGFTPIVLLILTLYLWFSRRKTEPFQVEGECHYLSYIAVDDNEKQNWNEDSPYPEVGYQLFYRMDVERLHSFAREYEAS